MKRQDGFTFVEILVAIAIGSVIILAIYAAVATGQRSTVSIERKVVAHQDARAALELMSLEIQMVSFNPTYATGLWKEPVACNTASGNQNYRGIQAASATSLTVETDINENGTVGDSNEIITYSYNAANQYITRSTNCGGGMPFLGDDPATGRPRAVRVINTDAVPVFRYFNAQGTEIAAAGLPAGIPNIARIDIVLWVETEDVDANTNLRRQMVYSTNVIPRNHVIIQ